MNTSSLRLLVLVSVLAAAPAQAAIGPSLAARVSKDRGQVGVVVLLEARAGVLSRATYGRPAAAAANTRALRDGHEEVIADFLAKASARGIALGETRTFWLAPAVSAQVDLSQIQNLSALPGVVSIIEDAAVELLNPVRSPAPAQAADATAAALDLVGVRSLWQRGLTGKGTLVASLDTGVDGMHPALKSRYRGLRAPAAAAWLDPSGGDFPNDPKGHGTHTMGTVLGCEPGDTVGVAPGAEWIAAGVVDRGRSLSETISDLLGAFQWLADPDGNPDTQSDRPDVVLNSWGIPRGILPDCDPTFWQAVDHLEALGTVVVFAAGNEGPGAVTLRQPADRGDLPLGCFSVGAVDALDPMAGASPFSSRGPTSCGSSVIKPELVAPGVNVRSCASGGGYKVLSGTSMAAPYVVGAVCLLRQYNPDASPAEIKEALVRSALDVQPAGPDYATGYGVLNVEGALSLLTPALPLQWRITQREFQAELASATPSAEGEVRIDNLGRSLEGVTVTVRPKSEGCKVTGPASQYIDFVPSLDGTLEIPLALESTTALSAGDRLWVEVLLSAQSPALDTSLTVGLKVGVGPRPSAIAVSHDGLSILAANTGRFDATDAEAVSVKAASFSYEGVQIPFTAGLQVYGASHLVSTFGDNDFEPAVNTTGDAKSPRVLAQNKFRDTRNPDPLGVEFYQRFEAGTEGPGAFVLAEHEWSRMWAGTPIAPGSWFRWAPASGLRSVATGHAGELCFEADGIFFGVLWLSKHEAAVSHVVFDPAAEELPLSGASTPAGDSYWSLFREPLQEEAAGRFTLAFVAGHSQADWQDAAQRAREQFNAASDDPPVTPVSFELFPSYPNPFNPTTTIHFALEHEGEVKIEVFNSLGRKIGTPLWARRSAGQHRIVWNAADAKGAPLPTGLYFLRVTAGGVVQTGKVTLLR